MNDKVKQVLSIIIDKFKSGEIPEGVAYTMFPIPDIPSSKWSLLNRTLMFLAGSKDVRGYIQWQEVDRFVKKGSKAIYILVPFIKKVEEGGDEERKLYGFGCRPVFCVEDTAGKPLDYEQIELPDLPFLERAKEWGISVKAIPGNYRYHGYYSFKSREIALATPEEKTFFHELSHAGHEKIKGTLRAGQDPFQEIVAELSAAALCKLVGKQEKDTSGNSYRYIEKYAKKIKMSSYHACLKVMSETEKVLNLILKGEDGIAAH
jgi:antirestriction protein ArdC